MGASQSARQAADVPRLPDGPIVRLSTDIWTQITASVDYVSIKNLLLTGNRAVRHLVSLHSDTLVVSGVMHSIDFDALLRTTRELKNLRELRIEPEQLELAALKPSGPLILPPTLTELYIRFSFATDFGLMILLKDSFLPNLTSLSLVGESSQEIELERCVFPQALSTLVLLRSVISIKHESAILNLPRSLTTLALSTSALPTFTQYCWPPQLEIFILGNLQQTLVLEHLPRTVFELVLDDEAGISTTFKDVVSGNKFDFPWRCFFPYLKSTTFMITVPGETEPLFRSLVSPTAYDSVLVDEFISSGFWNLPDLQLGTDHVYPSFKFMVFHKNQIDAAIVPVLRDTAAYLTAMTCLIAPGDLPVEALQYLPNLKSYASISTEVRDATDWKVPAELDQLRAENVPLSVLKGLRRVQSLFATALTADEGSLEAPWPASLTSFEVCTPLPNGFLLHPLPTHLTNLTMVIATNDEWTTLATTLVHLKKLTITLDCPGEWMQSDRLTPMVTPYLQKANIVFSSGPTRPQPKRFMDEFFGIKTPFPPSLTALEIASLRDSTIILPMTVCPYLPRQLRSLKLGSRIDWSNPLYKCEAPIVHLSPAELVANLPPKLESLTITQVHQSPTMTYELLRRLPKSLTSFVQDGLDLFSGPSDFSKIPTSLPPRLVQLKFKVDLDYIYFIPQQRLYRGAVDPLMALFAALASPEALQQLLDMYANQVAALELEGAPEE